RPNKRALQDGGSYLVAPLHCYIDVYIIEYVRVRGKFPTSFSVISIWYHTYTLSSYTIRNVSPPANCKHVFIKGLISTIMHEKSILTLEYPKIMEKVAREAAFSASKELVQELQPTPDLDEARRRLAFTTEAYQLIELRNDAGIQGAHDIRPHVLRAAREGVLSPHDLLEVLATIQSAIHVARLIEKLDTETFPLMHKL